MFTGIEGNSLAQEKKVFAICGEFSGESHLAKVVREIKAIEPKTHIKGMASSLCEHFGMEIFVDYKNFSFAGLTQVVVNLPKILSLKRKIVKEILEFKPDTVLLVDYAGFNLQVARSIKMAQARDESLKDIKIIQYIAPQIWASRPERIENILKYIDKVLCTLPFEEEIYNEVEQPVRYVGNPVLESLIDMSVEDAKAEIFSFLQEEYCAHSVENDNIALIPSDDAPLIGIFPGSRGFEIEYTLPLFVKTAKKIHEEYPQIRFVIAKAPTISHAKLLKCGLKDAQNLIKVIDGETLPQANQKLLKASDYLWLCSGTVTLEAALYEKPYFLTYKANSINFMLYKMFKIIDMAGLANIIAGKYIVKEFLQNNATVSNFYAETCLWFEDYLYLETMLQNLGVLREMLSGYETSKLVAEEVLSISETIIT